MSPVRLVGISASTVRAKKLTAVFDVGGRTRTVHFGAAGYNDYPTYCATVSRAEANEHKRRYVLRHRKNEDWSDPMAAGTLALYILWSRPTVKASIALYKRTFKV